MTIRVARDDRSTPILVVGQDGIIRSANKAAQELWGAIAGMPCMATVRVRDARGRTVCHDGCPRGARCRDSRWVDVQTREKVGTLHCSSQGDVVVVSMERLATAPPSLGRLTKREREVLALVASGMTTAAVAVQLGVKHSTARTHAERCRTKLRARTLAEAVARAHATHQLDP